MKKILCLLCFPSLLFSCKSMGKVTDKLDAVTFDVEFHRGGRNSISENTLYSYQYAIEHGATTIECDMQILNNEDVIVLSHDPLLDPCLVRDSSGQYVEDVPPAQRKDMRTMNLNEIKSYDVAKLKEGTSYYKEHGVKQITPDHAKIPTIDELFTMVKNCGRKVQINIETKIYHPTICEPCEPRSSFEADPVRFAKVFNDKVKEYGLDDQIILQSFDWQSLIEIKKLNKKIRTSALSSSQPPYGAIDDYLRPHQEGKSPYLAGLDIDDYEMCNPVLALIDLNNKNRDLLGCNVVDIFSPYVYELTIDQVKLSHKNKLKVIPWNANSEKEIETMYDMGVDGIISDNGDLLRDIMLKKGETVFKNFRMKDKTYHI